MKRFLDWTAAQAAGSSGSNGVQSSTSIQQASNPRRISPSSASQQDKQQISPEDLELQHLTRLLHEIKYYQASSSPLPSAINSQNQREFVEKVYKALPLFLNVFGKNLVQQTNRNDNRSHFTLNENLYQCQIFDDGDSSNPPSKPSSPLPPRSPPMDKFPDLLPFAFTIARLFVSEVRHRASNKHAEDASLAILQYLNPNLPNQTAQSHSIGDDKEFAVENEGEENKTDTNDEIPANQLDHGWNSLISLSILSTSQNSQIIQLLCDASLPSTLIKCLYLFFDLPATVRSKTIDQESNIIKDDQPSYTETQSTRIVINCSLIRAFTQILVQLCHHQSAIDELIKKDDLRLLIGIASNQCLPHNKVWRKTAFRTLLAISKNMRNNFMYIEQNVCIQVYVENMNRISSLGLASMEDLIDMIRVLIAFMYNLDVNNRNQLRCLAPLIEQFRGSRLLDLIEELLFKIDETILQESIQTAPSPTVHTEHAVHAYPPMSQQPSVSSEIGVCIDDYRRYGRRLIHSLTTIAKIYTTQETITRNTALKPLTLSRFEMLENFKMPRPSARDCILNNDTLRLFKAAWSRCRDSHIIEAVLDATIALFNDDKYNYFIFESQQLLVYYMTSSNFNQFPTRLKQKLFKFLEFIIIETNYIPCLEIGTIGTIVRAKTTSESDQKLGLRTLISCLRFNSKFSDIFREIGLLEVIIDSLIETMQSDNICQNPDKLEVLYLTLEASQYLLTGPNNLNCTQFNESGAARYVFNCLSKPKFFQIFIPPHSSSSDDGGTTSNASRTSTPTPTTLVKARHANPTIQTQYMWVDAFTRTQSRPSIKQLQKIAFTIIRQLILSNAGDEHLANLLGLLARNVDDLKNLDEQENDRSTGRLDLTLLISQEINLKIYILKSLMIILKDSHRCRALFRKVGGFVYIVSSLVTLERALPFGEAINETELECHNQWRKLNSRRIWRLIKNSMMTIVVAMRSEPTNIDVFSEDVLEKFTNAIRRLGCFNSQQINLPNTKRACPQTEDFESYKSIFFSPPTRDFSTIVHENIRPTDACCQIFRFLYDMSLDMADGTSELEAQLYEESGNLLRNHANSSAYDTKSISFDQGASDTQTHTGIFKRRSHLQRSSARPPSLDLNLCNTDPAILTFPCIILGMLDLIPSCPSESLIIFTCMVVKSLFKHERNQQVLCEAGMLSKLLSTKWQISITERGHFLHNMVEHMLECLTKQSITPRELRAFLRLGEPLCCKNLDEVDEPNFEDCQVSSTSVEIHSQISDEKVLTARIETFVAMMNDGRSKPPFVEFDMSSSSYSTIFMPSIAPVNAKSLPPNSSSFLNSTLDIHTSEKNGILGGVGSSERKFPPQTGLSFSTWICIEKFPARSPDANHNIRLLTIYRGSAATGKEYSCFRVQVSALDRALIVSTQETLLFDNENKTESQLDPECNLRVWTPETLVEGKWHHIAITMTGPSQKQGNVHVYIDGNLVHNQRICYINEYVGSPDSGPLGNSSTASAYSAAAFVNAFIGSLPQFRLNLKTRWKQGPCHLIEEPLVGSFVASIFALGPSYIGNFQASFRLNGTNKMKPMKQFYHQGKPAISHQQSASIVQSSPRHGVPLSRVSSSGIVSSPMHSHNQQQPHHLHSNNSVNHVQLAEDRILMNLDARATSLMTLTRMRRIYTRFDCRQVSRVFGLSTLENSAPILLLHNTGVHLNGPSCGIGAVTIGHDHVRCFVPNPTEQALYSVGGSYVLLGLIAQSQTESAFRISLKALLYALASNTRFQAQMDSINGYQILTVFFWKKKHLMNTEILKLIFSLVTDEPKIRADCRKSHSFKSIQQVGALCDLICENFDLWLETKLIDQVLEFIHDLINSTCQDQSSNSSLNSFRAKNLKHLRDMDLLPRMLRLLPQELQNNDLIKSQQVGNASMFDQTCPKFDAKAIYLIKQTVFELLNRTPRQADILYFGQFLASLLPSKTEERALQTINLRNVLLKSLLQMMTKNKQKEINDAMQEECVRILGFDWFMLFINGPHLDSETIAIGFLNLMVLLSNEELYSNFKNKVPTTNGGWLKEPTFPTIDGKLNIQLLGVNVGIFLGLSGKRRTMCKEVFEAPNLFLLSSCVGSLAKMPRIYLMIFQTMMNRLSQLDSSVFDMIGSFDKLTLDTLCDCLIGDTHNKRRQTLSNTKFRSLELIVCIVNMIKVIMSEYEESTENDEEDSNRPEVEAYVNYPTDIVRFFMYLYNNNVEFQNYCKRSDELIDVLADSLMQSNESYNKKDQSNRKMISHPASKEVLELSRLIILDRMTEVYEGEINCIEQLQPFERFLDSLNACKDAQGELVDVLLRQILLTIDSTARHNSTKTLGGSENILQFQLLLVNSISIVQIVADKIWSHELYSNNLGRISTIIDHQLCLAEQIFRFNELLPKHNPPHAFMMQRVLNRTLLFAISRPIQHMSDKILMLGLLKKIYDNRTIIILNHMHSPQSAEFFVCFIYWLIAIIENNLTNPNRRSQNNQPIQGDQSSSLIERKYGHPISQRSSINDAPSSSGLILVSLARKVWDAIYQSKKGLLAEALDVSLSLPAFTLDTSLDLIQLKPDIQESCERYWTSFVESEMKPKRRLQAKTSRDSESASSSGAASTAVNILSGRLTRVVNAANFVSRVVGATAGTMASNVNLVGEKFGQSRTNSKPLQQRSPSDLNAPSGGNQSQQQPSGGMSPQVASVQSTQAPVQQSELFKHNYLEPDQILDAHRAHISIIDDFIKSQTTQKNHKIALHKYLCDEWFDMEYEILLRERALFGPDYGSQLDKWCLDLTEGPRRMRKKMVNNTRQFYENYPHNPEKYNPDNKSLRYRPPMSYDSLLYHRKTFNMHQNLLDVGDNKQQSNGGSELSKDTPSKEDGKLNIDESQTNAEDNRELADTPTNNDDQSNDGGHQAIIAPSISIDRSSPNYEPKHGIHSSIESLTLQQFDRKPSASPCSPEPSDLDDGDSTSFVDFSPEIEAETNSARESENIDSLSVLRLLEKNERISHMFRCSRVQGLDTYEGLLLFGREHFYLIDGFTLLKTREIKDIESLPPDAHDPIIPNSTPNILAHSKKTCAKFSYDRVVEVHKRRYLLQPIALEVFSSDGRNTLIVFPRNIRNKVYSRLMTVATQITNNAQDSLAGQKSNVSVEGGSGLLSNLIGETSVTQRWVRGELSNFQYLMNLNTIAGRSYNDLMQYPIFPWILADYTSEQLDLTKSTTFRDLSRPVGAQTSDRLEQFKRRFTEWDDTETPPYHYGTFYSSAMIVASYMVRMEPFTQHFLRLQGGHFDLADRMFHSIGDSWLSASKHNMADIKELIPEFFYLPEFLRNENKYDLGIKQSGMKLHDVILPPWARDDAREFIRLHRCALESDYVSAHLHEWIDLIFGYKQQGQAAIDAVNVFHHLFYEGNVDIYNTDIDPIKKNAVIGFINNFGQVPKQLFKKPHPQRKVTNSTYSGTSGPMPLTPILPSLAAATSSSGLNQRVLTHYPQSLRPANANLKILRGPVGQIVQVDKNIVAVEQNKLLIPSEYCRYVAWGHADRSLRLGLYDSEKPIFVWEGSDNLMPTEILCCTIPNSRTMITAGTESLITVWKIEKMRSFTPVMNLYAHVEPVTCLASSQSYSLIVSGSRDKTAIIWDLNRLTFVRQLGGGPSDKLVHHGPISAVSINDSTGDIATCASSWLYLWTINGELLAQVDSFNVVIQHSMGMAASISSNLNQLHILSVCFSQNNEWDSEEVIVTGSSDGSVALWSMRYYQCPVKVSIDKTSVATDIGSQQDGCNPTVTTELSRSQNNSEEQAPIDTDQVIAKVGLAKDNDLSSTDKTTTADLEPAQHPQSRIGPTSEPIAISRRQRTDTMNSEWVKLSNSSTSTVETLSVPRATPTSPTSDILTSSEFITSGDFFNDGPLISHMQASDNENQSTKLATKLPNVQQDNNSEEKDISNTPIPMKESSESSKNSQYLDSNVEYQSQSSTSPMVQQQFVCDTIDSGTLLGKPLSLTFDDPTILKFSKSDTSLVDSFVILDEAPTRLKASDASAQGPADRARPQSSAGGELRGNQNSCAPKSARRRGLIGQQRVIVQPNSERNSPKLQPNHCWRRELFLRTLLPRAQGKNMPAAITSLAISKDHKILYVGDASGRITSWTTT